MKLDKQRTQTIIIALAAIACFLLIRHLLVSDEDRIKGMIYQGKAAIEREDFEGALKHVSRDYKDAYGLNKMAIAAILKRLFAEFDDIAIQVEDLEVTITERETGKKQGRVSFNTWVTFRTEEGIGYLVGSFEEPCQVRFTVAKEGRHWRVIEVEGVEPPGESWL